MLSKKQLEMLRTTRLCPAPSGLLEWLNAVNGLRTPLAEDEEPSDSELFKLALSVPSLLDVDLCATEIERSAKIRERDRAIAELRLQCDKYSDETVAYIFREDPLDPSQRLLDLIVARGTFRKIADSKGARAITLDGGVELVIEKDNFVVTHASFLKILDGMPACPLDEKQPSRLRKCEVCGRLFWAGRSDKVACKDDCSNVWRQRNHRKNRTNNKKRVVRKRKRNG